MSLHIGNLSSRVRRDDLERVFRRFGRCTIQVKDKYGFIVYDYPASAEKALKTLRNTRVCGEAITISWSKHQPHASQRFSGGGNSYQPPRRAYDGNADRRSGSNNRRDYSMDSKRTDGEVRKLGSSDLVNESISYQQYDSSHYVGEVDRTSRKDFRELGVGGKNHPEDERWGEQVVDPTTEKYVENGLDFDRYEPYHNHSDGKKELDENQHISQLAGSPSNRKSQERKGNSYNNRIPKQRSTSRNRQRLSQLPITPRDGRKEFGDKKRDRRDDESQDKNHVERGRGPSSSSVHSDYTSSRSQSLSRPLRSLSRPRSPSKSNSVPSEENSLSDSLRSSPSYLSGTKSIKSQSTSRSMSPTSSLSPVELNRHVSASPNETRKHSEISVANGVSLVHSKDFYEVANMVECGIGTSKSENITSAVEMENEFETKHAKLEQEYMEKDLSESDNENHHSVYRGSLELSESFVPLSNSDDHVIDNLFPPSVEEVKDSQNEGLVGEHILAPECDLSKRSNASNAAKMSSDEMYMVLKHYGLQSPEEKEKDLPAENYLGSARLWPWEMIYYRRLKKGSISAENYSRRVAQNEKFGIVDKYIRSSSGWGELN